MPNNIDRTQKTLTAIFFSDAILLIISFAIERSFRIANYFGYGGIFILGFLSLYTGYKQFSRMRREGKMAVWYKQPYIIVGLMTWVLAVLWLITNR